MSNVQNKGGSGRKLNVAAPSGGLASGALHILRSGTAGWCGVVTNTVLVGETVAIEYGHQVEVAKKTGESFAIGVLVYRDATTGELTATSTSNTLAGAVTQAAATADTKAWVQLNLN